MLYYKSSLSGSVLLSGVLYFVVANILLAGPVKSVDEHGNVTYSDKPVQGAAAVSKVPIVPGPSEAEVNAAEQQADKTIKAAKKISQENKAAREKKKGEQEKLKAAADSKQLDTDTTPTSNYPYYNRHPVRPRPPVYKPRPPVHKPRPPGNRPPVNLPTPRAGGQK